MQNRFRYHFFDGLRRSLRVQEHSDSKFSIPNWTGKKDMIFFLSNFALLFLGNYNFFSLN